MPQPTPLPNVPLGKTSISVSPIGLGTMQFAGIRKPFDRAFPSQTQASVNAMVAAALEGGINWFDTAELYGFGASESALAAGLKAAGVGREQVVIATKWWPFPRTAGNIPRSIDKRLECLDGYPISVYMVHQPFSFSTPEAEMEAMAALVKQGKVRSVGVSNFSAERMQRAHDRLAKHGLPLAVNQVHYSLLQRQVERDGVLELAKQLGVAIIAYTPLEYGLLTGKLHKDPNLLASKSSRRRGKLQAKLERTRPLVELMGEIGQRYNASAGQVALNWLVTFHGETVVAIPGASKPEQVEESAGALRFRLAEDELRAVDQASRGI